MATYSLSAEKLFLSTQKCCLGKKTLWALLTQFPNLQQRWEVEDHMNSTKQIAPHTHTQLTNTQTPNQHLREMESPWGYPSISMVTFDVEFMPHEISSPPSMATDSGASSSAASACLSLNRAQQVAQTFWVSPVSSEATTLTSLFSHFAQVAWTTRLGFST